MTITADVQTDIIMMTSEASKPHVWYGRLSRNISGSGEYLGTRSCVIAKLKRDALNPNIRNRNAKISLTGSPGTSGSSSGITLVSTYK